MNAKRRLGGRIVLVVEDDRLVALDIAAAVRREGARVAGPAATPAEALRLLEGGGRIDLAVLDVGPGNHGGLVVAEALARRGVPFVFATGCDRRDLPARFAHAPLWDKPFDSDALARFLATLSGRAKATGAPGA